MSRCYPHSCWKEKLLSTAHILNDGVMNKDPNTGPINLGMTEEDRFIFVDKEKEEEKKSLGDLFTLCSFDLV